MEKSLVVAVVKVYDLYTKYYLTGDVELLTKGQELRADLEKINPEIEKFMGYTTYMYLPDTKLSLDVVFEIIENVFLGKVEK